MKQAKKLFALLLTLTLVLSLFTVAAFADTLDTGSGSITISNATIGEDYNIYKIFDTDESGTGNITATETQKMYFESLTDSEGNAMSPFTFTKNSSDTYNVKVTDGKSAPDVIAFLQGFIEEVTDKEGNVTGHKLKDDFATQVVAGTEQTASSATVTFSDIPYGYYLITSSLGATVTVDSTSPNVTVIDKNQSGPSWGDPEDPSYGKTVVSVNKTDVTGNPDKISANYGDTVKFQVKFDATNYDGDEQILNYYVNDTLANGMSYVLKNGALDVEVKVGTETLTSDAYTATLGEDNQSFKITIPWVTSTTTDDGTTNTTKYTSPTTITVTYSATVDTDAVIAGSGNTNKATFNYETDKDTPGETHTSTEETVTTYTYALGFHKIDGANKIESLPGAEFSVKLGDTSIGAVKNDDGTYSYTSNANADGYTTTFVTDNDGLIVIKGVAAGTYTVTETKAPAGYNLLNDAVPVTATMDSSTTYSSTTTTYYNGDGNVTNTETTDGTTVTATYEVPVAELIVENNTGNELPSTGGMGTTLFYIIGGVLVLAAVVLLVTKKRLSADR